MKIKIGSLVREKEGPRTNGLVVESKRVDKKRTDLTIFWPDGTKIAYKSTFLEPIA
jgi:hypothetical protein